MQQDKSASRDYLREWLHALFKGTNAAFPIAGVFCISICLCSRLLVGLQYRSLIDVKPHVGPRSFNVVSEKERGVTSLDRPWLKHYPPHCGAEIPYPHTSLTDCLDRVAQERLNNSALHYFGVTLTYRQLTEMSNRFAQALVQHGSRRGTLWESIFPIPRST